MTKKEIIEYLRLCADVVAFIPDYEQSRGAQLEWAYCQYTGNTTMYM